MLPVDLPSEEVLTKRFLDLGLEHFEDKTSLAKKLATQKKSPMVVAIAVECAIDDYIVYLQKSMSHSQIITQRTFMSMLKPNIFEAILQDHSAALLELQQVGIYVPATR